MEALEAWKRCNVAAGQLYSLDKMLAAPAILVAPLRTLMLVRAFRGRSLAGSIANNAVVAPWVAELRTAVAAGEAESAVQHAAPVTRIVREIFRSDTGGPRVGVVDAADFNASPNTVMLRHHVDHVAPDAVRCSERG